VGTALVAAFFSAPAFAQDQPSTAVGGPGESCRARSDCKAGLKCVNQTCADEREGQSCAATSDCGGELKCVAKKCTSGSAPVYSNPGGDKGGGGSSGGSGGGDAGVRDWLTFRLEGIHPFAGLTWGGGFLTAGITGNGSGGVGGNFSNVDGNFLFALHGGVFIDKHQLKLELAPFTYLLDAKTNIFARGGTFELTGSYAYFIPIYDSETFKAYWPLRVGLGFVAGADNTAGLVYFQPSADVVGVALQIGHVMIDMHLPSFRYAVTDRGGTQLNWLSWVFGASVSYVF
jgi:hypothetical protein